MADKVLCDKSDLVNVADAVRSKLGVTNTYYVSELSSAIQNIQTGGITPSETWVIKSDAYGAFATTQISFTSNGQKFTSIGANYDAGSFVILRYDNGEVAGYDTAGGDVVYEFYNDAYRKLTFDTPPTGDLLTWLQSNATKQPNDTAVQDTKALTITSNGTVSVTPDAPYDGLSSVDVTVNVASSGGSSEYEECTVQFKGTIYSGGSIVYALLKNGTVKPEAQYLNNTITLNKFSSIRVLKNSLFVVNKANETFSVEGNVSYLDTPTNYRYVPFWVTGDCKIDFS